VVGFLLALQFLTIVPVRVTGAVGQAELSRSLAWYPIIGAALGLLVAAVALGLRRLGLPEEVVAALALALAIALTGGLHLDGLVDTCDGVFAQRTPAERLAIMRDPRVGSFGLAGGVCLLLVKYAALMVLPGDRLLTALPAAFALGRAAMVGAAVLAPPGRLDGLGVRMTGGAGRRELLLAWPTATIVALLGGGQAGLIWIATATIVAALAARWLLTRLPGLTGDTYGALNEATEAAVLVAAAWRVL
jgi:adenosylcobinamide-GDP ribazoletransferase